MKRSEAIGGIVRSIALIPDQILRSTYLSELAQRLDIKEQTLLNTMNGMIAKNREEKQKQAERDAERQDNGQETPTPFIGLHGIDDQTREVERLLIQAIIRHGEEVIYENVETDDGGTTNLTVAQYVAFDLGSDALSFHDGRYNQILDEAVAHSGEPDFKAEAYFLHHPDVEIVQLAAELAIDRHQLGESFQPKKREDSVRQYVLHLVLDLRMDIVEKHLKEIQTALKTVGSDKEQMMKLLEDFRDTQQLRDALAKQLGNDIIT